MSGIVFQSGTWVWINDNVDKFIPAKVLSSFSAGTPTTVLTEDGEKRKLSAEESKAVCECNPEVLDSGIDDLINMNDLNEMSILHNLRIRFKENQIYTNISSILVSMNPFKLLPLYTPAVLEEYRMGTRDLPPHVFNIAYNAYNSMLIDSMDQSVVIAGESGAGKSEATKLILQFLAEVSTNSIALDKGAHIGSVNSSTKLEQQLLAANPILEAFGNAKTLRNNNSSRFGKLITVMFNNNGGITGGRIINYLLEKSRVVGPSKGERNYHIFYQLLHGGSDFKHLTSDLKLLDPELFDITNQSGVVHIDGINDDKEFEDVIRSFDLLGFSDEEKKCVFRLVVGVLYLGNTKFTEIKKEGQDDIAKVLNKDAVETAAGMWGVDEGDLEKFLVSKYIGSRDLILVDYKLQQAIDAKDGIVKRVYGELFQLLVNRLNLVLSSGQDACKNLIGVLDIFGFESFAVNSFEQLCINYCNEKLQFHFNEHIFSMEQRMYKEEGVSIPATSFVDNQATLDLLELKVSGLFSMCDEEIALPRGSDETLLAKMIGKHGDTKNNGHPNFAKPKPGKDTRDLFGVVHYAGTVFYKVTNFLDKNKDQLNIDLVGVMKKSTNGMMKSMFAPFEDRESQKTANRRGSVGGGGKPKTLGAQFKAQLQDLMNTLNATNPHFIRCIKPNDLKVGGVIDGQRIQDQLRYSGLVEVCRIRKLGFPVRRDFNDFFRRYSCCVSHGGNSLDGLLGQLDAMEVLVKGEWAKGRSKIFLRSKQSLLLEELRETCLTVHAQRLQRRMRTFLCMNKYRYFKKLLLALSSAAIARSVSDLEMALENSQELPHGGRSNSVVRSAKLLMIRLNDEHRAHKLLESAVSSRDLNSLIAARREAISLEPPYDHPTLMKEVDCLIIRIENENQMKNILSVAIHERNYDSLVVALDKAALIDFDCVEIKQAATLKIKLEEEMRVLKILREAVKNRDLQRLSESIDACIEVGIADHVEVVAANACKTDILEEQAKLRAEALIAAAKLEQEEQDRLAAVEQDRLRNEERQRAATVAAKLKHEEMIRSANECLLKASSTKDVVALGEAIQNALEVGVNAAEVNEASELLSQLTQVEAILDQIKGELRMLELKVRSGIFPSDLDTITNIALKSPLVNQIDDTLLAKALLAIKKYTKEAELNEGLRGALVSSNKNIVQNAINLAEDCELENDLVIACQEKLRNMESQGGMLSPTTRSSVVEPIVSVEDVDAMRAKRMKLAANGRFMHKNYPGLRSADNFARGSIFQKSAVKVSFLMFTKENIPKSLTEMKFPEHNKQADQAFKDIQGYMGDKIVQYPATLARDLLQKGLDFPELRPEIFLQIIKQLSENPRAESVAKGWQLLCMCVGVFPPGEKFENYLLHYIMNKRDHSKGAVVDYANFCLRSLESTCENNKFLPSIAEIEAYRDRPPILATLELVDGTIIAEDIPVTPDQNVERILEMTMGWLDLHDERMNTLGIFVYDMGQTRGAVDATKAPYSNLPRTPRPLRNEDYLGDMVVQKLRQRRDFRFIVKKKLFMVDESPETDDPNYSRLIFMQAERDIIFDGIVPVLSEEYALDMGGVSMVLAFGEETPTTVEGLMEVDCSEFIAPCYRESRSVEEWASLILPIVNDLVTVDDIMGLQSEFIKRAMHESSCRMFGTHWFYVYKFDKQMSQSSNSIDILPRKLLLGFNIHGLHVCDFDRNVLLKFDYSCISRWGGGPSQFSVFLNDDFMTDAVELSVVTAQAQDMAGIIMDYIQAIHSMQQSDA